MTPQEKAIDLIEKFKAIETLKDFDGMDEIHAIQCALICVKEIIDSLPLKPKTKSNYETVTERVIEVEQYWQQVKEEITKL